MPKTVTIFADGACSGNPGPGGWGAILRCESPSAEKELSGAEKNTTNNRMELTAIIKALDCLKEPCSVTVVTDSQYVANAFKNKWIDNWLKNGWRTASKQPVKNKELWQEMLRVVSPHQIKWQWIKGHNGHPENERADALAVQARESIQRGM